MATTKRRIHARGDARREEGLLTAVVASPGHLVEMTSAALNNGRNTYQKHSTEGGSAEFAVLGTDQLQGKLVTDAYAVSSLAQILIPHKGSTVNAMIKDGQDIAIGEQLMSGGDGTLLSIDDAASGISAPVPLAEAVEACDLTGSNTSDTLCEVRVL